MTEDIYQFIDIPDDKTMNEFENIDFEQLASQLTLDDVLGQGSQFSNSI